MHEMFKDDVDGELDLSEWTADPLELVFVTMTNVKIDGKLGSAIVVHGVHAESSSSYPQFDD